MCIDEESSQAVHSRDEAVQLWVMYTVIGDSVLQAIRSHAAGLRPYKPVRGLLGRLQETRSTLGLLLDYAKHDFAFDAAILVRASYDIMLQCLYILHDPAKTDERIERYQDFIWIEKHEICGRMNRNKGLEPHRIWLGDALDKSGVEQRCRCVRDKHQYKSKNYWYGVNLEEIAKEVGHHDEYDLLQKEFSGVVHSSPYSLLLRDNFPIGFVVNAFWTFYIRVLDRVTEFLGIPISPDMREFMVDCRKSLYAPHQGPDGAERS